MNPVHIVIVFLAVSASAVTADPKDEWDTTSGWDRLLRFGSVSPYLAASTEDKTIKRQIAEHCENPDIHGCITYLRNHKHAVLNALPDNPQYWAAFNALLEGPPIELDPLRTLQDASKSYSLLIEAAQQQWYRQIAGSKPISAAKFANYYTNARRLMAQSNTLIERMIFTAIVGIAHQQFEGLMAVYAAEEDVDNLRILAARLTPFSTAERSLRLTLSGEAQYVAASIETAQDINVEDFQNSPYVEADSLEELRTWAKRRSAAEFERIIDTVGDLTERGWSDYWQHGWQEAGIELQGEAPHLFQPIAYISYAKTARSAEVAIYPLLALSDIYLGLTSAGLPARRAPPHWNWSWDDATHRICLMPTHVAPNAGDYSLESPPCVTYLKPLFSSQQLQ